MLERVDVRGWLEFQFPYMVSFLGGAEQVAAKAIETGAFVRPREIRSAEDLLRLILMWSAAEQSYCNVAALAAEMGIADVSDVALVRRFSKAGDWLGALLGEVLAEPPDLPRGVQVRLVDATTVSRDGVKGTDHRLHIGMNLGNSRITSVELTNARGGESLERFSANAGEITISDAGYATRAGLSHLERGGGYYVTRFAWTNLPLEDGEGEPFDILAALRSLPEAEVGEFPVRFRTPEGERLKARLIAVRKSEPAAAIGRDRVMKERSKRGRRVDPRTLEVAGYVFVLTNLPDDISGENVLELYRFRWQIEMKFKTLKSLLHLDEVPARTDAGLRVYVLAKLLVATLIEFLIENADSFSPWGYPIPPCQQLASDPTPS
jgi:hypothetical protein